MESKIKDIDKMQETIQEVQTTNHFILKRLNQIVPVNAPEISSCTCYCGSEQDLTETMSRVHQLEKDVYRKEEVLHKMADEIDDLQQVLRNFSLRSSIGSGEQNTVPCLNKETTQCSSDVDDKLVHCIEETDEVEAHAKTSEVEIPVDKEKSTYMKNNIGDNVTNQNLGENKSIITQSLSGHSQTYHNKETNVPASDDTLTIKQRIPTDMPSVSELRSGETGDTDSACNVDEPKNQVIEYANFSRRTSIKKTGTRSWYERDLGCGGVEIIEQKEKKYHFSETVWDLKAAAEEVSGKMSEIKDLSGIHSVICIDISASMADEDAWLQAKKFFDDYISGLETVTIEERINYEHVAMVTFGHDTKVVQRFTNDFTKIRHAFGNIKLGGPSPMYGGVMMSIAAMQSSESIGRNVGDFHVYTKIILITDGKPTDGKLYAGPDMCETKETEATKSSILMKMALIQEHNVDLFCVPVGKADREYLDLLVSVADGKMLTYEDGRKLSRRYLLTLRLCANPYLQLMTGSTGDVQESDREHIQDIIKTEEKKKISLSERRENNQYTEIDDESLPQVGLRVRRGPDWKWGQQDSHGPGTIIGHDPDGVNVWVEWDADEHRNTYHYGFLGQYHVLLVDEPRVVKPGRKIAVGCVVKQGIHWKDGFEKISSDTRGVVIRVLSEAKKVQVRWNKRERGDYSYGLDGVYEVELCKNNNTDTVSYTNTDEGINIKMPQKEKRNKNKNNIV